jgi:hypothetical protein
MVPDIVNDGFSGPFAIRQLDGTPDPLSGAAGVGIAAIIALGLIALAVWLWSRS